MPLVRRTLVLVVAAASAVHAFRPAAAHRAWPPHACRLAPTRTGGPAMLAELDPAALEALRLEHVEAAHQFWNNMFLAFAGIVGSVVNAPARDAKRYADAQRKGPQRARQRALPQARDAPAAGARQSTRGGGSGPAERPVRRVSAEDELLDTFRW